MRVLALSLLAYGAAADPIDYLNTVTILGSEALSSISGWQGTSSYAVDFVNNYVAYFDIIGRGMYDETTITPEFMNALKPAVEQIPDVLAAIVNNLGAYGTAAEVEKLLVTFASYNAVIEESAFSIQADCSSWEATWSPSAYVPISSAFSSASVALDWTDGQYAGFNNHACTTTSSASSSAPSTSSAPTATSTYRCLVRPTGSGVAATSTEFFY